MTGGLEPGSFHSVAAALRADASDVGSLTRVLTATLGDALPAGMVEVERDRSLGDRLAGRPGRPVAVRVRTDEHVLELRTAGRAPAAEVQHVVRGVVLSRRQVGLDEWVDVLAQELTALARRDAAARQAVSRLLGID